MEISKGRVELMELLEKEREVRFWRRQRRVGKGPARLELDKSMDVIELVVGSHLMPDHEHGLVSLSDHEERAESGSERESFICWR